MGRIQVRQKRIAIFEEALKHSKKGVKAQLVIVLCSGGCALHQNCVSPAAGLTFLAKKVSKNAQNPRPPACLPDRRILAQPV